MRTQHRRHRLRHFWRHYGDFLVIIGAVGIMAVAVVVIGSRAV